MRNHCEQRVSAFALCHCSGLSIIPHLHNKAGSSNTDEARSMSTRQTSFIV